MITYHWLALAAALSAPCPPHREVEPRPCAGEHTLWIEGTPWRIRMYANGTQTNTNGGAKCHGHWSWDGARRVFTLTETQDGVCWFEWRVHMPDRDLSGKAWGAIGSKVRLELGRRTYK